MACEAYATRRPHSWVACRAQPIAPIARWHVRLAPLVDPTVGWNMEHSRWAPKMGGTWCTAYDPPLWIYMAPPLWEVHEHWPPSVGGVCNALPMTPLYGGEWSITPPLWEVHGPWPKVAPIFFIFFKLKKNKKEYFLILEIVLKKINFVNKKGYLFYF